MHDTVAVPKVVLEEIIQAQVEKILLQHGLIERPGEPKEPRPWDRVRAETERRLQLLPKSSVDRYNVLAAVTTIIRTALNLDRIRHMTPEQEPEALKIAHAVLDLMRVPRPGGAGGEGAEPGGAESGA